MELRNRRLSVRLDMLELTADVPDDVELRDAEIEMTAALHRLLADRDRRRQAEHALRWGKGGATCINQFGETVPLSLTSPKLQNSLTQMHQDRMRAVVEMSTPAFEREKSHLEDALNYMLRETGALTRPK